MKNLFSKRLLPSVAITAFLIAPGLFEPAHAETTLGGLISTNTSLSALGGPYRITSTLEIAPAATLSLEPGTTVDCAGLKICIWVHGKVAVRGNANNPVTFTGNPGSVFSFKNAPDGSGLDVAFAVFDGGGNLWTYEGYSGYPNLRMVDSQIFNLRDFIYVWYPPSFVFERNALEASGGLSIGYDQRSGQGRITSQMSITNNLFKGPSTTDYWIESWATYGTTLSLSGNSFVGGTFVAVRVAPNYKDVSMSAESNFWDTTDVTKIRGMVRDSSNGLQYSSAIATGSPLVAPAIATPRTVAIADAKIKAKAEAEAKAKAEAEAKAKAEAEAKAKAEAEAKAEASRKKTTIVCVKGKLVKRVVGVRPVCPKGYKRG